MKQLTAERVIDLLGLEPLPFEGGAFRETYRSTHRVPGVDPGTDGEAERARAASTQIYYLLRPGESSALHRVRSDEVFHHYLGDPVVQLRINDGSATFGRHTPMKSAEAITIGPDLESGHRPQVLAPRDVWQGAVLQTPGPDALGFALLGCTVAPGFEWDDFELITPERAHDFARQSPEHAELIARMTPVPGRTRS